MGEEKLTDPPHVLCLPYVQDGIVQEFNDVIDS